ncbi:MAG: hypothetical protein U1C46_11160 [Bacteroidales bacterium]|nr:hypothetical protein [Bacteroidales bacterium]MDZ4205361.1 hypothetical protein [Bacteroidales bacterium]
MNKAFRFLILMATATLLSTCQSDKKQEQIHTFESNMWNRFNILSFDIPVGNIKHSYSIFAIIRITNDFQHNSIPVHFIMTSPGGEERIWEKTFAVRNSESEHTGTQKGMYFETILPIRTNHRFTESGNHHITIEQIIPKYDTQGVGAFGIKLAKE